MGSWNKTCMLTNMAITSNVPVVAFLLERVEGADYKLGDNFCYNTHSWLPVYMPFYGTYDTYGGLEDIEPTQGSTMLLEAVKNRLVEFELGTNPYHDCVVSAATLNWETLQEAIHEGRLLIEREYTSAPYQKMHWDELAEERELTPPEQYLKKLVDNICNAGGFKYAQVQSAFIRRDAFDEVINNYRVKSYHNGHYVEWGWSEVEQMVASVKSFPRFSVREEYTPVERFVNRWMSLPYSSDNGSVLNNHFREFFMNIRSDVLDNHKPVILDYLKSCYFQQFISSIRKDWQVMGGEGSQEDNIEGYQFFATMMQKCIDADVNYYKAVNDE